MIVLLLLLGPVVLGAKLLGASCLVALFIGLSMPLAVIIGIILVGLVVETRKAHRARKRTNQRRQRAGLPPLRPWWRLK